MDYTYKTGWIGLDGKYHKDGIKDRPIAFIDHGNAVELRWLKLGKTIKEPLNEVMHTIEKNGDGSVSCSSDELLSFGIRATEELLKYNERG